jgi:hypothetical protein
MEDMQQEEVEVEQPEEEEGDGLPFADGGIEIAPEEDANSEDDEPLHRSDDNYFVASGANDQDAGAGEHSQADDDSRIDEDAGSRSEGASVGRSDAFDEGLDDDEEHDDGAAALQEDYWRAREECFMRINEVRFSRCYDATMPSAAILLLLHCAASTSE